MNPPDNTAPMRRAMYLLLFLLCVTSTHSHTPPEIISHTPPEKPSHTPPETHTLIQTQIAALLEAHSHTHTHIHTHLGFTFTNIQSHTPPETYQSGTCSPMDPEGACIPPHKPLIGLGTKETKMQQGIQERQEKLEKVKTSVQLRKANIQVISDLIRLMRRSWTELKDARRQAEMLSYLLQSEDIFNSVLPLQTINMFLYRLVEDLNSQKHRVAYLEMKELQNYKVEVTLDPDTAHPSLILSEDGKQVTKGETEQEVPDNPERFDMTANVLGKQGFSSGRFYYEVQVGDKTQWELGVARESINRKGEVILSPEDGFWTIWLRNGKYEVLGDSSIQLSLSLEPQKVGVYVDYEEGLVSFYDVDHKSRIYSFTNQTFTEKLYPYFSPGLSEDGTNSAPLVITPVASLFQWHEFTTDPMEEHANAQKTPLHKTKTQQVIQDRQEKIQEVKAYAELIKVNKPVLVHLMRFTETYYTLFERLENWEKEHWGHAMKVVKHLDQEITDLQKRSTELVQLSFSKDTFHLLQSEASLQNTLPVGTTKAWLFDLLNELQSLAYRMSNDEMKEIQVYKVEVTLDPDTAHPYLILSEDGKQVRLGDRQRDVPDNPERFDYVVNVLGKQGFSSGRFYYEVQVGDKTVWALGVARESINRKGDVFMGPQNGFWTIWLREGEYRGLADSSIQLSLSQEPQTVGVYVDYEEGRVSFYDVEARSHIYSFTGQTFTEKLYPYFNPGLSEDGTNSAPLVITPVNQANNHEEL